MRCVTQSHIAFFVMENVARFSEKGKISEILMSILKEKGGENEKN